MRKALALEPFESARQNESSKGPLTRRWWVVVAMLPVGRLLRKIVNNIHVAGTSYYDGRPPCLQAPGRRRKPSI